MDYVFKYTQGFLLMNLFSSEISIFPAIVLNYIEIYLYTDRGLGVAVLAGHGEVQAEGVAVDHVHVASLGPAQGIDPATEGFVGAHIHHDPGVLAVNGN